MVFTCVFWLTAGLFLIIDVTGRPSWARLYKVQPNRNTPVSLITSKQLKITVEFHLHSHPLLHR